MVLENALPGTPTFNQMAFGNYTPKKAFFTAIVLGSVLTLINHGDVLLDGKIPSPVKVLLT